MSEPLPPNVFISILFAVILFCLFLMAGFHVLTSIVQAVLNTPDGWPTVLATILVILPIGMFWQLRQKRKSSPKEQMIQRGNQILALNAVKKEIWNTVSTPSTLTFISEKHTGSSLSSEAFEGTFDCQNMFGAMERYHFSASAKWSGWDDAWKVTGLKITRWSERDRA